MVGRVVVGMSSSLILSFYLHCGASLVVEGFLHLISIVKSVKGVRDIHGLHQNTQRRSRCEIPNARRKWTKRLNSKSSIHGASPDDLTTCGYLPHLYGIRRRVRVGFVWSCPRGIMIVISELSRLVGRGFEGLYLSRDTIFIRRFFESGFGTPSCFTRNNFKVKHSEKYQGRLS